MAVTGAPINIDMWKVKSEGGVGQAAVVTDQQGHDHNVTKSAEGVFVGNLDDDLVQDILITEKFQGTRFDVSSIQGEVDNVVSDIDDVNGSVATINVDKRISGSITMDNDNTWNGISDTVIASGSLSITAPQGNLNIIQASNSYADGFNKENSDHSADTSLGRHDVTARNAQNVGTNLNITMADGVGNVTISGHVNDFITTDALGKGAVGLMAENVVNMSIGNNQVTDTTSYSHTFDITATDRAIIDNALGTTDWKFEADLS
ncbi:MAG: hypothetical protein WC838_03980, partial [Candidatus Margulisiibacteriota bacterium]